MKVGRNDPCPCGSGKKYKLCCHKKAGSTNRVFSYAHWEMFWGFNPSFTNEDRQKLKDVDGSIVQYANVCDQLTQDRMYYFDSNPFASSAFLIPEILTRSQFGCDRDFMDVARDDSLTMRILIEMRKDSFNIPITFKTISYVYNLATNKGGFAITSISKRAHDDFINIYKLHSQIWSIDSCYFDQCQSFLSSKYRFLPNGVLEQNNDFCVFVLPLEQIVEFMSFVCVDFCYCFSENNIAMLSEYFKHYDEPMMANNSLKTLYEGTCVEILDIFSDIAESMDVNPMQDKRKAATMEILKRAADHITQLEREKTALEHKDVDAIRQTVCEEMSDKYAFLSEAAMQKIVEGETYYRLSEQSEKLSFDAAIVSYASAVEIQLYDHLITLRPGLAYDNMSLGAIIRAIENNKIAPYHRFIKEYKTILNIRNAVAHKEISLEHEVKELRYILFTQNLLKNLRPSYLH